MQTAWVKVAWDDLWYNTRRTIFSIALIALALSAIVLYKGYVEYSSRGLKLGFIEKSGHFQIAKKGFWEVGKKTKTDAEDSSHILSKKDLSVINNILKKQKGISSIEPILEFNGIIGNEKNSTIFFAYAYEHPETNSNIKKGVPVFAGDNSLVLGEGLAKFLGADDFSTDKDGNVKNTSYVNVMSVLEESGMSLATFAVSGTTQTGVVQVDNALVITSRQAALELFGMDNSASFLQVVLENEKNLSKIITAIKKNFADKNIDIEIRTWWQLNPAYDEIKNYFLTQFYVISTILLLFVFVALVQALTTNFLERLPEFGTLEAIGMKKSLLQRLLFLEAAFLSFIGIACGLIFSFLFRYLFSLLQIKIYPPGYSTGYVLEFFLTFPDTLLSVIFIFFTCILAAIFPVWYVMKKEAVELIRTI